MGEKRKKVFKLYKNLSIKKKMFFLLYIQIIIPLILIGYMSYKISSNIIEKKSMAYSQDILHMIELRLKDYANNLSIISQDLIYDRKIYAILKDDSLNNDPINDYENEDAITNILKKVILSRSEIQSICFLSKSGKPFFFDNNSKKASIVDIAPFDKILVKAREGHAKVVWYLDIKNNKVENIYLARTIYNQDDYSEIGLMVIMLNKGFLGSVYEDLAAENMQNISIISENNDQIVSRNQDATFLADNDLQRYFKSNESSKAFKKSGTLISYVTMDEPNWKVVSYISLKELNKEIDNLREWIILLSVLSVIIVSILSVYVAVDFISPINKLVKGMVKLQKGEDKVHVSVDREDELGYLNKTFNSMSEEIHHLVTWVYREQITRKEAELKALQSQINPHFLFNTLESINWMAQFNNAPEISETVSDLSALMEASIGRDDKLITLEEEFNYTDKYISIIKRRFEDKIEWQKEVQKEALGVKIPRLLIQPLIENAVYHGIEKRRSKGIVSLSAAIINENLLIEVMDNGNGIKEEELLAIKERLEMDNNTYFKSLDKEKSKSIGIENVNRRIKLFYGENYGLDIQSKVGEYTKVIVSIPLHQSESKEGFYVQGSNN